MHHDTSRPERAASTLSRAANRLADDDAALVTGARLTVDGGRSAVMQDDQLPDYRERRRDMEDAE